MDRFLFSPADERAAAIFRIGLAAMLGLAFWSPGADVGDVTTQYDALRDLYDPIFLTWGYWGVTLLVLGIFAAGVRSRFVGLVLLGLLAPLALLAGTHASRQILLVVLAAFSLVRSDGAWSVRTWRGGPSPASAGPMWPVRLIQIQLSVLYLVNALAKATPAYLRGDVLEDLSVTRPNFLVDLSDGHLAVGAIDVPVAVLAVATVTVEVCLGVAFWIRPLRWIAAGVGIGFHLALQRVIDIGALDYVAVFLYLAFLLPWERASDVRLPPHRAAQSSADQR